MKKIFIAAVCLLAFAGCASDSSPTSLASSDSTEETIEKKDGVIQVVASFYPLAYMAEQIGGDFVQVTNIVGAGDPHDYRLSPRDIQVFQSADVVLLQGANLEPWGEDIERQLDGSGSLSVVADGITLMEAADGHDEHDEEGGEDEHEDEHDHGAFDPHTWIDPILAQDMVEEVRIALVAADPGNADYYSEKAVALTKQFVELDIAYVQGLKNCERRDVILSHDAFGYLAKRYDFTVHAIAGISTQDEPSAKTLALLKEEAAEGITHILAEQTAVNRFAHTLSAETGLEMLPISALAAPADDGADFVARARENLAQIQTALGCGI